MRTCVGQEDTGRVGSFSVSVSGLSMAKRPNSPSVRGFGGVGLSPRDWKKERWNVWKNWKSGRSCSDNGECE